MYAWAVGIPDDVSFLYGNQVQLRSAHMFIPPFISLERQLPSRHLISERESPCFHSANNPEAPTDFLNQAGEGGRRRDGKSVHISLPCHPYVTVFPPAPLLSDIAEWKTNYQASPKTPSHSTGKRDYWCIRVTVNAVVSREEYITTATEEESEQQI